MSQPVSQSQTNLVKQTISEDVENYCDMRRQQNPEADALYSRIYSRLGLEPVTEVDFQAVWSICSCPHWIDALMYDIVKFNVLDKQPAGGYIELFIETEMLRLSDGGAERVVAMYQQHKRAFSEAANAPCVGGANQITRGVLRAVKKGVKHMHTRVQLRTFLIKMQNYRRTRSGLSS